jgi:hypothetical protein
MQKSSTFTTIFRVKKCYFHYDMQKKIFDVRRCEYLNLIIICVRSIGILFGRKKTRFHSFTFLFK